MEEPCSPFLQPSLAPLSLPPLGGDASLSHWRNQCQIRYLSQNKVAIVPNSEIDKALVLISSLILGDHLIEITMISELDSLEARDIKVWIYPTHCLVKFHLNLPWLI